MHLQTTLKYHQQEHIEVFVWWIEIPRLALHAVQSLFLLSFVWLQLSLYCLCICVSLPGWTCILLCNVTGCLMHVSSCCSPLSGRMSLQGRARGVMECWHTRAVRLPGRKKTHKNNKWTFHKQPQDPDAVMHAMNNEASCTSWRWPVEGDTMSARRVLVLHCNSYLYYCLMQLFCFFRGKCCSYSSSLIGFTGQ